MTRSLLDFVMQRTWLLEEGTLQNLVSVVQRHDSGQKLSADEVHAIVEAREQAKKRPVPAGFQIQGGVGVIPITGVIAKFSSQVNGASSPRGTSIEAIRNGLHQALEDESVETIVLDVDSPGGSADGVPEMADEIYEARQKKRIVAITDGMVGSAAYFLASQAHEIVATKGAEIGSIGTYAVLVESRRAAEQEGFDVHVLRTGKFKGVGVPGAAITDEQKANIQGRVDAINEFFVEAVARGRGVSMERARELADGAVHITASAIEKGLADRIGLPTEVIAQAQKAASERRGYRLDAGPTKPNPEAATTPKEDTMADPVTETLTADKVAAEHPAIAEHFRAEGRKEGVQQGQEQERERISYIRSNAAKGQDAIVDELITSGADKLQSLEKINANLRATQAAALERSQSSSTSVADLEDDDDSDDVEVHEDEPSGAKSKGAASIDECPLSKRKNEEQEKLRVKSWETWQKTPEAEREARNFETFYFSELNRMKREGRY